MTIIEEVHKARRVSAPFIAIETADQINLKDVFVEHYRDIPQGQYDAGAALICWDVVEGFQALNEHAKNCIENSGLFIHDSANTKDAFRTIASLEKLGEDGPGAIILIFNAHMHMGLKTEVQALMNLRTHLSSENKTVILMGPRFDLPAEIAQDILVLEEELPDTEQIKHIITDIYTRGKVVNLSDKLIKDSIDAVRGLPAFSIEQAVSMSVPFGSKRIVDVGALWKRKAKMIEQVKGLRMEPWAETFDDVGGLQELKKLGHDIFSGPEPPIVICWIDELDKVVAGSHPGAGDTSGVKQDQMQVFLTDMIRYEWGGVILVGPAGTGKSFFAKALASTYRRPLLPIDMGAAMGSLMGQSQSMIRALTKAIYAMAGFGGAYFVGTANRLDNVLPEFQRRFYDGVYFTDLPSAEERDAIAKIHMKKYEGKVKNDPEFWKHTDGWSAANIRDAIRTAYRRGLLLKNVPMIPAWERDQQGIRAIRALAHKAFYSASYPGSYKDPEQEKKQTPAKRKFMD